MASVAICPHCYLQLVVPDGVEPDELVECPTCAKEFSLDRAVLRAIPEIVRKPHPAATKAASATTLPDLTIAEEVIEVAEFTGDAPESAASEYLDQLKARIEKELSAGNLLPGMTASLPLDAAVDDELSLSPEAESELLDEWHRPTVRVHDLTTTPVHSAASEADDVQPNSDDDSSADSIDATHDDVFGDDDLVDDVADEDVVDELAESLMPDDLEPEPAEPAFLRPSATTLADLMPRGEDYKAREEAADVPGPSFELPNVPLTPTNFATVEFDPNTSFGAAADSEFALDDVDFAATDSEDTEVDAVIDDEVDGDEFESDVIDDELVVDQIEEPDDEYVESDESADSDEPVFGEPPASPPSNAPFILPGLPPRRRKRSIVRTLVGTALGGAVGALAAAYILLWILGPDGDFLQVAKYLPSAALPKSFQAKPAPVIARSEPAQPPESESAASENMPATFTEEVKPADDTLANDETAIEPSTGDTRYGEEPSPLDEPVAEPIDEATSAATIAPLPLQGPTYTLDQLATALDAATEAQPGLISGDLNDAAVRRAKGMSYAKFCDLAEALTFADRTATSVESEQANDGAVRLFRETLSDARTRTEVDRIATIWIDSPHRRHGGVFLAGTLSGGEIAGEVYEYELATEDGNRLTLLAAEPFDPAVEGSQLPVGIVGSIVANPTGDVAGYQGTANRAIWVTRAIPLD